MDDHPPRRRFGCWGFCLIVLGCVAVSVVAGVCWLLSSSDLDRGIARARSLGLATSWEELGLPRTAPSDQRVITGLQSLIQRANLNLPDGSYAQKPDSPFDPPSAGLQAWDSGIDAALDALIDGLAGEPCWSIEPDDIRTHVAHGDAERAIAAMMAGSYDRRAEGAQIFSLRSAQARTDPQRLGDLLVKLIRTPANVGIYGFNSTCRLTDVWIEHVLRHRNRLDPTLTATTASRLRKKAQRVALTSPL